MPAGLGVLTRPLDDPGRLLDLLPDDRALCWLRGSDGLVGWGEVARFSAAGPDRFAAADAWWRVVHRPDRDPGRGRGARLRPGRLRQLHLRRRLAGLGAGGAAGAGRPARRAVLDHRVLARRRAVRGARGRAGAAQRQPALRRRPAPGGRLPVGGGRGGAPDAGRRRWTRPPSRTTCWPSTTRRWTPGSCSAGWRERYPTCWSYAVDGLVGATPELLIRRTAGTVQSRVLAGTSWPDDDRRARRARSGRAAARLGEGPARAHAGGGLAGRGAAPAVHGPRRCRARRR